MLGFFLCKIVWNIWGSQANFTMNLKLGIIDFLKIAKWAEIFRTQQKHCTTVTNSEYNIGYPIILQS